MKLLEVRQSLYDTSIERDIFDNNKIIKKLLDYLENTDDLSKTDFEYISTLLLKAKTLLYRAYTIFKINDEEVSKNVKKISK